MDEMKRGKGIRGLLRHICFAAFGIAALVDVTNLLNPVNLIFGAVIGILFGILCRAFFSGVLGAFNKDLKKVYNMEKMYVLNGLNEVRLNSLTFISIHFY